jgi:dihydroorotase/N-acyl-D-amino-acid deacylase
LHKKSLHANIAIMNSLSPILCALLVIVPGSATMSLADEPSRRGDGFDVLIRGGLVIDGSGRPGRVTDVAVIGRRIVAVGDLHGLPARVIIDASRQVVCPGFIDLHSHADRGILEFRGAENYIRQGVTTLLCGNCGSSPTDVADFFGRLRSPGTGPNIALLIGHGSVRQSVMGRRNAPPTAEQLAKMKRIVREAMQAGAVGLSTSLRYGPGSYASTGEIVALAREIVPFGGFYATHMRDEGTRILEALEEALQIGRRAGVAVHVSHHKISSASVFGMTRQTLSRIDAARKAGIDVSLDQYPYAAGSGGVGLYVPQASLAGGLDAFRRRVADPERKRTIVAAVEDLLVRKLYEADQSPGDPDHTRLALARVQIARARHDEQLEGLTLVQVLGARRQKITLRNGALLLVELVGHGVTGINHTLDARPGRDVDRVMSYPHTSIASDGSVFRFGEGNPHPRSYGCFPRVLGHYVRNRKLLGLETAIHKMTALPARRLGWVDRGLIRTGQIADLTVFDSATVADKATFLKPHQHSVGILHVLVAGTFVLKNRVLTDRRPGRPVGLGSPPRGNRP